MRVGRTYERIEQQANRRTDDRTNVKTEVEIQ